MPNRLLRTRSLMFSPKKLKNRQIVKRYEDRVLGSRLVNSRRRKIVHGRRTNAGDEA